MKRTTLGALLAFALLASFGQDPAQEKKPLYDEEADGAVQIEAALVKARRHHKRVLIQWGGNWCRWCTRLDDVFTSDAKVRHELLYEYELVHVDIGRWDKHQDLTEKYGADTKGKGVPYLTFLDGDGKLVANEATDGLEQPDEKSRAAHDSEKVLALLEKHRAQRTKAEPLLKAALARAQKEEKGVFLLFGAPW